LENSNVVDLCAGLGRLVKWKILSKVDN